MMRNHAALLVVSRFYRIRNGITEDGLDTFGNVIEFWLKVLAVGVSIAAVCYIIIPALIRGCAR
jgi:hypothetical protein